MGWRWWRRTRPGGGSHTNCTWTASHISLSERDVLRLLRTLSLFLSTLSLDIVLNRREHQSLYKIPSERDNLGAFTIPIAPQLCSKYRYRLIRNRPISWRSPPRHAFLRRIYNCIMDWVKESDGGTSKWGQDGKENRYWGRGGIPLSLSPK